MKTFWQDIGKKKRPFFALAPMDGATDSIFRRVVASVGRPDVFFTEFTNVEGLFSDGTKHVEERLYYTEEERPLIAQIWGLKPELFYKAAQFLEQRGFDGIDINMGCPVHTVTMRGACSALIKNPTLAKEIIDATKQGAGNLPVSVKTRIGFSQIQTEEWIGFLLEQNLDALIVHGRTSKEMSKVPAHWDEIGKVVALRDSLKKDTVVIGNGDIKSISEGKKKAEEYGVDGIMIGRGIFENIWVFKEDYDPALYTLKDRLEVLQKHLSLYEKETHNRLPYQTLKKYFKIYIRDFDGASELRVKLMETNSLEEVFPLLHPQLGSLSMLNGE